MLTADLVRVRIRGGVVTPAYVDPDAPALREVAACFVKTFEAHVGRRRGELDAALAPHIEHRTDFRFRKGLVKLLLDRSTWQTRSPRPPTEVRQAVFALAARMGPITEGDDDQLGTPRARVVAEVAAQMGTTLEAIEEALYADLRDAQVLEHFEPLDAASLLHRYNTALAQGVLLRATDLDVTLDDPDPQRVRAVLRAVKFHGLIHQIVRRPEGGYVVHLDGPSSLFRLSSRYGVRMAAFLPTLLHAQQWQLQARVLWPGRQRTLRFTLGPDDGLRPHGRLRGAWIADEQRWFLDRVAARGGPWRARSVTEILDLGGGQVVVPDLVLEHDDGRRAWIEIIGFWRKASLQPRLHALRAGSAPPGLMLAISTRLRASEEDVDATDVPVVWFKGVLPLGRTLELADAIACRPG